MFLIRLSICIDFIIIPVTPGLGYSNLHKKSITIGELSGQYYFGQKGQSYCSQRGQSCLAKRVKVAWLFQLLLFSVSCGLPHFVYSFSYENAARLPCGSGLRCLYDVTGHKCSRPEWEFLILCYGLATLTDMTLACEASFCPFTYARKGFTFTLSPSAIG